MKIEFCSVWEGFDGERFEVVDRVKDRVVVRSVVTKRRIEVPAWKFGAGMLSKVDEGRKMLYAPGDVGIGKELWSLDYDFEIKPERKKGRLLCRITKQDLSVSYKHLTVRKICALLNRGVDHIVDGDLRAGVELKNGIRIEGRSGRLVWFSTPCGCRFVSDVETFLDVMKGR